MKINGVQLAKGDRVTFSYSDPHKSGKEVRTGTVETVKGNAIVLRDDDRKGAFRSFSGVWIENLLVM